MASNSPSIQLESALKFFGAERGAYKKLDYEPVFRGSALFYAIVSDKIDTQVTFMNYWREKNNVNNVAALVTLRDRDGHKVNRDYIKLSGSVYAVSCRALLEDVREFEGSLEIEIFSDEDIKFPFSAINVFYASEEAVSFVHANQRVFNNLEDMDRNAALNPWQTGFDVFADDEFSGFVSIVNGPRRVRESEARLIIINRRGASLEHTVSLGDLPPYGARMINLAQLKGVSEHLGGESGWAKVDVDLDGVFNRFLCGNISRDGARLSATHSFYDCAPHADYIRQSQIPDGEYTVFIPFSVPERLDLDIVFYPICSPATLELSLELRDPDGRVEHRFDDIGTWESAGDRMMMIDVREEFRKRGVDDLEGKLGILSGRAAAGTDLVPMRINHGMNYRIGRIGCNISNGIQTGPSYGKGVRAYRWGPIMAKSGATTHLLVFHLDKRMNVDVEAEATLTFWGTEGALARRTLNMRNGTAHNFLGEELLSDCGVSPDQAAGGYFWYTLEANSPSVLAYELHETAAGFIGGDHSF